MCLPSENAGDGRAEDSAPGEGILPVLRRREKGAAHHLEVFRGHHSSREQNKRKTGKRLIVLFTLKRLVLRLSLFFIYKVLPTSVKL